MKLSSRKTTDKKLELSTTGMIDIVFLLLVFFLVTSSFQPSRKEHRPATSSEEDSKSGNSDHEKVVVEIVSEGAIFIYKIGDVKTTSVKELQEKLASFEDKSRGAYVKTAGDAKFDMTAQAFSACEGAGFQIVTFVTGKSDSN